VKRRGRWTGSVASEPHVLHDYTVQSPMGACARPRPAHPHRLSRSVLLLERLHLSSQNPQVFPRGLNVRLNFGRVLHFTFLTPYLCSDLRLPIKTQYV
jgi:hypothetical protein